MGTGELQNYRVNSVHSKVSRRAYSNIPAASRRVSFVVSGIPSEESEDHSRQARKVDAKP